MSSQSDFPNFWRLQAAGWIGLYVLMEAGTFPYALRRPEIAWITTCGWAIWFLASCALRPVCRSLVQRSLPWFQLELRAFAWTLLAGALASFLIQLVAVRFRQLDWADQTRNTVQSSILLLFWCNLYFSIKHWQRRAEERERLARAEADARDARLAALRYQLNPHFLFNSLNAVSTLVVEGETSSATRMLSQIADLLRATLDSGAAVEVPLSDEIAFTRRYLAVEQVRLGERLKVDLDIEADTVDAVVPSLLLQPLVENAVRHGVAPSIDGGFVVIESKLQAEMLQIRIRNSGSKAAKDRTAPGFGLANTAERLRTLYGHEHRLELIWPKAGGCEVQIEIPFRKGTASSEKALCVS